jgi:hypothetical protein
MTPWKTGGGNAYGELVGEVVPGSRISENYGISIDRKELPGRAASGCRGPGVTYLNNYQ